MTVLRSLLYHLGFYLSTSVMVLVTLPILPFLGQNGITFIVRTWARWTTFLLLVTAGTRMEVRGLHHLPDGACIVAAQHQSMFETIALIPLLDEPSIVMKEQIRRIPVFGVYTERAGMIAVDRSAGASALRAMTARAREEIAKGRKILIFPEGTRRPPGAPARYQSGIGLVYRRLDVPVVPVALNSGLYWPRNSFMRYPGTIVVEVLPPIEPGLDVKAFQSELAARISEASARLIDEAAATDRPPPLPDGLAQPAGRR